MNCLNNFIAWGHDNFQDMVNSVFIRVGLHLIEVGTELDDSLDIWIWFIRYTPLHESDTKGL